MSRDGARRRACWTRVTLYPAYVCGSVSASSAGLPLRTGVHLGDAAALCVCTARPHAACSLARHASAMGVCVTRCNGATLARYRFDLAVLPAFAGFGMTGMKGLPRADTVLNQALLVPLSPSRHGARFEQHAWLRGPPSWQAGPRAGGLSAGGGCGFLWSGWAGVLTLFGPELAHTCHSDQENISVHTHPKLFHCCSRVLAI